VKYVVLVILMVPPMAGCVGADEGVRRTGSGETSSQEHRLGQVIETKEEAKAREDRAALRERLRAKGERVCEEGETGTRWLSEDGCNTCRCYEGVRGCTVKRCPDPSNPLEPPPARVLRRTPPESSSKGD
jgi:hypothetical protein